MCSPPVPPDDVESARRALEALSLSPFTHLPTETKKCIAQKAPGLLMVSKEYATKEFKTQVLLGRGDFVSLILNKAKGEVDKLPQDIQEIFKDLDFVRTIEKLELSACQTEAIVRILHSFPYCKTLRLSDCSDLTALASLRILQELNSLKLSSCNGLTDNSFQALDQHPLLTSLFISKCPQLTGNCFDSIAKCPQITSLCLIELNALTDAGLSHITKLQTLDMLSLLQFKELTDQGFQSIAGLKKLTSLSLLWERHLTAAGLSDIIAKCTQLVSLRLTGCNKLTRADIDSLRKKYPHIVIKL